MLPPRYVPDETALVRLGGHARLWRCPSCGRMGTLNAHGALRGGAEKLPGKDAVRGRRFFCSDRGRRPGCGRTFSVLLAQVLRKASVRTTSLWRFCQARLSGLGVLAAWEQARSGFSLESAYRWWRRWQRGQLVLRTILAQGRDPPPGDLAGALTASYGADDPIGVFQLREQRGWP